MTLRNIIEINEEKCDGCGLCISGCAEGALAIVDGKAKLISDVYCDGLGACLEECPNDALQVIQREAAEFDEEAVEHHLAGQSELQPEVHKAPEQTLACGCPSSQVRELPGLTKAAPGTAVPSALTNWPVQLHLVPEKAPFFEGADLLIAADCTGFSLTNLHRDFLPGRRLIIACPKLDETSTYMDKLSRIIRKNGVKSIHVLYMTVPCCGGLVHLIRQALKHSGVDIPLTLVNVDPTGFVVREESVKAA
jgi:ferredoxin